MCTTKFGGAGGHCGL